MGAALLPVNHIKSELSLAYILALSAAAGFACEFTRVDLDSVDATLQARGLIDETCKWHGAKIEVQLKASSVLDTAGESFAFDLPVKNYNDLRVQRVNPAILVVLALPKSQSEWIRHDNKCLSIFKCAYWHNLLGAPETKNKNTKTISVSTNNEFNGKIAREFLINASRFEPLRYE